MIIRSRAPLRISFSGGGTEVSPYKDEYGGVVLCATIDKYAYGSLRLRDDRNVTVTSLDYDIVAKYNLDSDTSYDGELDLVKAVIKNLDTPQPGRFLLSEKSTGEKSELKSFCLGKGYKQGFDFFIHSDAPPGSGLGSSSTMVVALIGLLKHWQRLPLTNYEIANLAYHIERVDLGIKGGMQDQYAAVFGGFNFIEFGRGPGLSNVVVNPLRIGKDVVNELEYRLVLCYTGRTRLSANIINSQVESYVKKEEEVLAAMEELKKITTEMKNALLQARLDDFGRLLHEAWINKKKMAKQITNTTIDGLYDTARKHGALGGKILGAGGGGYLLLYCEFDKKHIVAEELEKLGGQVVEFTFDHHGLQTWEVRA
jgi:D-glycero-alpha-D-manno-heptose-7-phosphate kinase